MGEAHREPEQEGVLLVADGAHLPQEVLRGREAEFERVPGGDVVGLDAAEERLGEAGVDGEPVEEGVDVPGEGGEVLRRVHERGGGVLGEADRTADRRALRSPGARVDHVRVGGLRRRGQVGVGVGEVVEDVRDAQQQRPPERPRGGGVVGDVHDRDEVDAEVHPAIRQALGWGGDGACAGLTGEVGRVHVDVRRKVRRVVVDDAVQAHPLRRPAVRGRPRDLGLAQLPRVPADPRRASLVLPLPGEVDGRGVLVVFPACDASLVLGVGEVEARVEHAQSRAPLGRGPAEDVHAIPVTDRMLLTFEELLREPLRVGPPGEPLGERFGRGVVEGDGLLIAEEEGAGSVDEEGRVAVLADVLAACVGVVSGLPDALGQVEPPGVGAVGAEDSVCGETSSVGLVDPRLAGEGFVAAEFGDVREGRVLVVQVGLHGFSPRRVFGHGEDARGGVTRTRQTWQGSNPLRPGWSRAPVPDGQAFDHPRRYRPEARTVRVSRKRGESNPPAVARSLFSGQVPPPIGWLFQWLSFEPCLVSVAGCQRPRMPPHRPAPALRAGLTFV